MSMTSNDFPDDGFNDMFKTVTIVSSVMSVAVVVIIAVVIVFICKNRKKLGKEIVNEVREITATAPPSNNFPVCKDEYIGGPTMDRFFKELANDKPVRFTAPQLCTFTTNYTKILGSGAFGKVYQGKFPNGVKIAVKVLNRTANDANAVEKQFMAEVGSIGRVHHINLVKLFGFCYDQFISALVYEFMENGSLDTHLFCENPQLQWEKLHEIALETAKGIAYLHEGCEKRIIHYDIKPGNVLLDAKFSPKVADFGLAELCSRDNTHVSMIGYRGTPGYIAPEMALQTYPVTYKCDVYSFGMLMFEIVRRRRNNEDNNTSGSGDSEENWFPKKAYKEYEKGELIALVEGCGIEEKDRSKAERMCMVAMLCVQDQPEKRPQMSAVVKMLEGGMEIVQPLPTPFNDWFGTTNQRMDSHKNKKQSTAMRKYEINVATE